MAIFITQGRFTSEAIKGLVAHPEDRYEIVAKLGKKAGVVSRGWWELAEAA
jgi:hypothetical protein